MDIKRNLTMLMDFYELTMANGYLINGLKDEIAYYDMFFRRVPDGGGFAIMAGLEQLIEYIENLKFTTEDIEYLRDQKLFRAEFLEYLKNFKFSCDIWAVEEGNVVFPNEPILTVRGPIIEAQLIETMILLSINHQSLIATKANRIKQAAKGRAVIDFGSRRAQGADGAIMGARAAFIGGVDATSCVLAAKEFGIPAVGTMAHSWVQTFDNEYEAFYKYAKEYPDNSTLLVDTYNVLNSGVPNAIKVFDDVLKKQGKRPKGIRIDSGDLAYLSKKARKMLDDAGYHDCKIVASNALDEYLIKELVYQEAKIDIFGVGERLITSRSEPVFGGVYKLVAIEKNQKIISKIKLSENIVKITNPGVKKVYRFYSKDEHKALADLLTLENEVINENEPYELFDPNETWKKKKLDNYYVKDIRTKIYTKGQLVYKKKNINEIKNNCLKEVKTLWEELLRFENPPKHYVDLSEKLWEVKNKLILDYNAAKKQS